MALASLSSHELVKFIRSAERRVAYMAPGVHEEVAAALCHAFRRLGPGGVSVILDTQPEVFRLGYGTIEALEMVCQAAERVGVTVGRQAGVQVGVLVADDTIAVFAPKPLMVSASELESGEVNGLVFDTRNPNETVAEQVGAVNPLLGREFGIESVSPTERAVVKADLEKNPPQQFDVFRKVNVFNASFEFVELEVTGSNLSKKEVTLPKELAVVSSGDVGKKMTTTYRLFEENEEITSAQAELTKLRRQIEKEFLRVIPGYGFAVLRTAREEFDEAIVHLKAAVTHFHGIVDSELKVAVENGVTEISGLVVPRLEENETEEYNRWSRFKRDPSPKAYVDSILRVCFSEATKGIARTAVNVVFKSVTYESLKEESFLKAARKAFPELEDVFEEFDAAKSKEKDLEGKNGTQ